MKNGGVDMVDQDNYNLLWTTYTKVDGVKELSEYQKVNHFPGSINLGRKDLLWRSIKKMQEKHQDSFGITPQTWILTEDFKDLEEDMNTKYD